MDDNTVLELKQITKSFPGVKALSDVNFVLKRATVHAIVGENGAGKSTLMKILSGMYTPDNGEIWIDGKQASIKNERDGFAYGVSMIYQELNSVLDMAVYENIFLGRMPHTGPLIRKKEMLQETDRVLNELGIPLDPKCTMRELSVAQRQMVEIAKAISRDAKIIVMDEPTSSISQKETEVLFKFIKLLTTRGVSIIYISHRLEELAQIADEITILRDGKYIHHCAVRDITKAEMIQHMVGRELTEQFPKTEVPLGDTVLKVDSFSSGRTFQDISFSIRKGEILGFSGLVGAGRTEVMRALFGLDSKDSGAVELEGKRIIIQSPSDAIAAGIALVGEDRRRYGLVLTSSVKENSTLAHLKMFLNRFGLLRASEEKRAVLAQKEQLRIKCSSIQAPVSSMSGGNQQKVVLAKWMIRMPKILILDEPTRGIDVGAKVEIYKIMGELAAQGIAIIMISSELPEILGMSDRVLVMADGQIKGELKRGEATQERIMKLSAGGV